MTHTSPEREELARQMNDLFRNGDPSQSQTFGHAAADLIAHLGYHRPPRGKTAEVCEKCGKPPAGWKDCKGAFDESISKTVPCYPCPLRTASQVETEQRNGLSRFQYLTLIAAEDVTVVDLKTRPCADAHVADQRSAEERLLYDVTIRRSQVDEGAAALAPTVDFAALSPADFLRELGDDAAKWAAAFQKIVIRGGVTIDEGLMIGWFANAIEHSSDVRRWRAEAVARTDGAHAVADTATPAIAPRTAEQEG